MAYFIRKLAEALVTPIGLSLVLMVAGMLVRRRWLIGAAAFLLWITSTSLLGDLLLYPLQSTYPAISVADCPAADAIVVLSGGIARAATAAGTQWGESVDRYLAGVALANANKAPRLVFTEGAVFENVTPRSEGETMRQNAIQQGIAPERIYLTGRVRTTEDESREVAALPGLHSIVLVTSAFHMRRAVMLFRSRGLQVIPFPTDQRGGIPSLTQVSSLIPTAESQSKTDVALREYYGLLVYSIILPKPH